MMYLRTLKDSLGRGFSVLECIQAVTNSYMVFCRTYDKLQCHRRKRPHSFGRVATREWQQKIEKLVLDEINRRHD